jgi:hypothetical protein
MIEIKVKRTGNIDKIVSGLSSAVSKGIGEAVKNTHDTAIELKHRMTNGGGSLDKNVVTEKTDELSGRVYTNNPALMFAEYGTGVKKDPDFPHIGRTKTFIESGKKFWLVPAESVSEPIGHLITIGENQYYMAFSQSAKPFMRSAAFNRHYKNVEDVQKYISELIRSNSL